MPNQRFLGKTLCAFWLDPSFQEALDAARKSKHMDRSTFIRWAIAEEMKKLGIEYDEQHVYPPDRAGKGGPRSKRKLKGPTP